MDRREFLEVQVEMSEEEKNRDNKPKKIIRPKPSKKQKIKNKQKVEEEEKEVANTLTTLRTPFFIPLKITSVAQVQPRRRSYNKVRKSQRRETQI